MLDCEELHGVGVLTERVLLSVVRDRLGCGSRLACGAMQRAGKRGDLVGPAGFVFRTREEPGDLSEESRWIAEGKEPAQSQFEQVLSQQEHHLGSAEHPQDPASPRPPGR